MVFRRYECHWLWDLHPACGLRQQPSSGRRRTRRRDGGLSIAPTVQYERCSSDLWKTQPRTPLDEKASRNHISPWTSEFSKHAMCPNGLAAGPRSLHGPHTSLRLHLYWKCIRSDLKYHRFCNGNGSRGSSNPIPYFVDKICKILFEHGKKKPQHRHIFMAFYKADWSLVLFVRRGRKELWQEGRGMAVRKQSWPRGRSAPPPTPPRSRAFAGTVTLFLHTQTLN